MKFDETFELRSLESVFVGAIEAGPAFTSGSPSICRFEFRCGGAFVLFLGFEASV